MQNDESKTLNTGWNLARVWGPILLFGIGIGMGWSVINNRVATAQAQIDSLQAWKDKESPQIDLVLNQVPDMRSDVAWVKLNMYQLLIKQGIQPVDPKTISASSSTPTPIPESVPDNQSKKSKNSND